MSCPITLTGILENCTPSVGGLKRIYIAPFFNVSDPVDGVVTLADTSAFKAFYFKSQTGTAVSTLTKDLTVGTQFYTTELTVQFDKLTIDSRNELEELSKGKCTIVMETEDGEYILLGYDWGADLTAMTQEVGTALGDFSGYKVTLTDMSKDLPYFVDSFSIV